VEGALGDECVREIKKKRWVERSEYLYKAMCHSGGGEVDIFPSSCRITRHSFQLSVDEHRGGNYGKELTPVICHPNIISPRP